MEKIKVFEMFAGYGGASFALKKANVLYECVGYSEIDKHAIKCFDQNFPNIKNYGDCSIIDPEQLPDFDLLTGGFPCQDVSVAGNRDMSKGRTLLVEHIFRIARVKRPKYLLLENVKGLLSFPKFWTYVKSELRKIGYHVLFKVLNTKDYGVPQNRERIWIVCKLGKWNFMEFEFPQKEKLKLSIKDLLEKNVDKKYRLTDNQMGKMKIRNRYGDHILKKGDEIHPCLCSIGASDVGVFKIADFRYDEGLRIRKDNNCPCLSKSLRDNSISNSIIIKKVSPCLTRELSHSVGRVFTAQTFHNMTNEYRRLTPKECFRLMGFLNDEINLDGIADSHLYGLAGNGWDINVVSKIFKNLFK